MKRWVKEVAIEACAGAATASSAPVARVASLTAAQHSASRKRRRRARAALQSDASHCAHSHGANTMEDGTRLLEGIKVLDVATFIFGPAAATVMSDFGADVIKIEHPTIGDPYRYLTS